MSSPFQLKTDGSCQSCNDEVQDNEIIKCFRCKLNFHALCKGSNAICNKSLLVLYQQKSTKKNFVWFCDICLTEMEINETESMSSHARKFDDLENKIGLLSAQLSSISDTLSANQQAHQVSESTATFQPALVNSNPWQNTSKVTIMKNSLGPPDLGQLEQRIVNEQIQVSNSKRNNNGDIVITCPTSTAANKIKELATELLPQHTVKDPSVKYSWVNVVGFEINHSPDSAYELLVKNNIIFESLKGLTHSEAKDFLEVKAVKPCAKNQNVYRALIKVSTALRQLIKRRDDKLRIGLYSCRVYDQTPQVKRCNKCQRFGHWVAGCSVSNGVACAKCGSDNHESRNCPNSSIPKCINCTRAGIVENHPAHTADSPSCPCFNTQKRASYSANQPASITSNGQQGVISRNSSAIGNASQPFNPYFNHTDYVLSNYGAHLQPHAHHPPQMVLHPQMVSSHNVTNQGQHPGTLYSSQRMHPNSDVISSLNH